MAPDAEIKQFFTVLASPTRLAMLWLLADLPRTQKELQEILCITQAHMHNEIKVLHQAGLIYCLPHSRNTAASISSQVKVRPDCLEFTVAGIPVRIGRGGVPNVSNLKSPILRELRSVSCSPCRPLRQLSHRAARGDHGRMPVLHAKFCQDDPTCLADHFCHGGQLSSQEEPLRPAVDPKVPPMNLEPGFSLQQPESSPRPAPVIVYTAPHPKEPTMVAPRGKTPRKVKCLETNIIYDSAEEAAKKIGRTPSAISVACRLRTKCAGHTFQYLDSADHPTIPAATPRLSQTKNNPCLRRRRSAGSAGVARRRLKTHR